MRGGVTDMNKINNKELERRVSNIEGGITFIFGLPIVVSFLFFIVGIFFIVLGSLTTNELFLSFGTNAITYSVICGIICLALFSLFNGTTFLFYYNGV